MKLGPIEVRLARDGRWSCVAGEVEHVDVLALAIVRQLEPRVFVNGKASLFPRMAVPRTTRVRMTLGPIMVVVRGWR